MQINYSGYCGCTGYAIASQEYVLSMLHVNPEVNIRFVSFNADVFTGMSQSRKKLFSSLMTKQKEDSSIHLYHSIPIRYRRHKGSKKNIGLCVFETITPPKEWIDILNEMDSVITPSEFNKNVFVSHGVTRPITVVPHCFDTNMFNNKVQPSGRYGLKTFLSIGTWKMRKNWEALIHAFYAAFSKSDNVCLLIKTDQPKLLQQSVEQIKRSGPWRSKDTAPIYAEPKTYEFEEMPQFMKKGDYYICTSLGEGFNLGAMHAMALGMPVIVPRFGGVLEYATTETATFIEPKHYKKYPSMDGTPQFNNCIWPVMDVAEISNKMREVVKNYPVDKVRSGYDLVHSRFNYNAVGTRLLEAIHGI